ncbi:TetR/AcrR family transcriptional regulator [Roseibium salinum]|uniref:TetR/AcrR family transcriptional regulator n=1 Tax=Roseibium salinum TaxID=1604349 RepID=A0ABT3QZ78_9HYPH|nr:TetR/AcrR family transcriptional regulator [Roseibium sp. DSM 29163]MCX2722253.1 TetR/AcrR family transcriptional regulator [Roseibium sp. DSM 29163]MDN3719734.1 TetR/AcrR family transcriptional regulator [Roseibium salinum]
MTRKPQQRSVATRARVLQAARELTHRHGLEQVTAESVAVEAGVAKGTVFAHFGDMDGLLSHVLLDRLNALHSTQEEEAASAEMPADPVGNLLRRIMAFIAVITDSPTILRLFLDNIGVTKPNCAAEFVETLGALDADLASYLGTWQADEAVRPALRQDRSPAELVDGLIAFMIHGAILLKSHQLTDRAALEARLRRHVEAYLLAC